MFYLYIKQVLLNAARETQNRMLSVKELLALAEVWPVQQRHVHSYMAKTNHISVHVWLPLGALSGGEGALPALVLRIFSQLKRHTERTLL